MPKYVFANGLRLEVRDVSEPIFEMGLLGEPPDAVPLPCGIQKIMSDDEARTFLNNLKETGYYTCRNLKKEPKNENTPRIF